MFQQRVLIKSCFFTIIHSEPLAFGKNDHGTCIANPPFYRWRPIHHRQCRSNTWQALDLLEGTPSGRHTYLEPPNLIEIAHLSTAGCGNRDEGFPVAKVGNQGDSLLENGSDKAVWRFFCCCSDWETVFWCICSLVLNSFGSLRKNDDWSVDYYH